MKETRNKENKVVNELSLEAMSCLYFPILSLFLRLLFLMGNQKKGKMHKACCHYCVIALLTYSIALSAAGRTKAG